MDIVRTHRDAQIYVPAQLCTHVAHIRERVAKYGDREMVGRSVRVDQRWRLTTSRALSIYLIPRSVSFHSPLIPSSTRDRARVSILRALYFCIRPCSRSCCGFARCDILLEFCHARASRRSGTSPAIRNKYI